MAQQRAGSGGGGSGGGAVLMGLLQKVVKTPALVHDVDVEEEVAGVLKAYAEELLGSGQEEKALWLYSKTCSMFRASWLLRHDFALTLYRARRWSDALALLEECMQLAPEEACIVESHENIVNLVVERWHFRMLNDKQRNVAYRNALQAAVAERLATGSTCTVLDIGAGTGLLSLYALEAGATAVYACEMNAPMAEVARACIRQHQQTQQEMKRQEKKEKKEQGQHECSRAFGDAKIHVLQKHSGALCIGEDLPEKVDIVVTELVDAGLLGEHILPVLADARARLLKPDGVIIPDHAHLYGAVVSSTDLSTRCRATFAGGAMVLEAGDMYTCENLSLVDHTMLTPPVYLGTVPLSPAAGVSGQKFHVPVTALATGTAHAIVTWFDMQLLNTSDCSSALGEDVDGRGETTDTAASGGKQAVDTREHIARARAVVRLGPHAGSQHVAPRRRRRYQQQR
ncbi:hypothetical protein PTSG_05845 [Salpingoeca rosetta]|uniref:Uncharacterized protein n=1 Tax=Salpingoeca rosetta (strain ATCC 50818 / BSB-021) TaxID=946362 RepID=F2UCY6_SALR5|nr:uncharacterized protein PTSG_05845 [Salpingoeca rosetta]EGD74481.1 hypothetical protein PTSG_05845 [Salpingoeca rosetta]|eukprot:XP_004992738.1 hypothetical protein PTSG_05845 [Salpingoeca rosetta]